VPCNLHRNLPKISANSYRTIGILHGQSPDHNYENGTSQCKETIKFLKVRAFWGILHVDPKKLKVRAYISRAQSQTTAHKCPEGAVSFWEACFISKSKSLSKRPQPVLPGTRAPLRTPSSCRSWSAFSSGSKPPGRTPWGRAGATCCAASWSSCTRSCSPPTRSGIASSPRRTQRRL
jgi:hypothetical protein